jgi:hypothetical protein
MGHHDIFFKQTFSIKEHAVDYLRHVLPAEISTSLDYSGLHNSGDTIPNFLVSAQAFGA